MPLVNRDVYNFIQLFSNYLQSLFSDDGMIDYYFYSIILHKVNKVSAMNCLIQITILFLGGDFISKFGEKQNMGIIMLMLWLTVYVLYNLYAYA